MADDITLTVRVRDLTRGDFNQLRQRLRGLDADTQHLARTSGLASDRAQRLSQSIRGVSGRMGELHRTGGMARHEMDFMRRTMSLLTRDLRNAARAGELTAEEFRDLQHELERTRLDFDYLDRDIRRHSAVAQRAHREEQARQREAAAAARQRMRDEAQAARQAEAEARRRQRDEERRLRERARMLTDAARRRVREEERAEREASAIRAAAIRRRQQQDAAAQRAAVARMRDLIRQQQAAQRSAISRLAASGSDGGLNMRFRGMDDGDLNRMARSFASITQAMNGVSASSSGGRRSVAALSRDLQSMTQILSDARREGNLTRREFDALSNGLAAVSVGARDLRRSGDMTRSAYRGVRREVSLLQREFGRLGGDSRGFGRIRSALSGLMAALVGLGHRFARSSRFAKIFLAVLLLIGPAAAALGALLTAVLGGAFIALGAVALKNSTVVKNAFRDMKDSVTADVREAAQPMEGDLAAGIRQVAVAVRDMKPLLTAAFTATGPLIHDFVGGFTDLAGLSLDGIVASLRAMGPAMDGFRTAMGLVGQGIGEMFKAMTAGDGAEALKSTWITVGAELKNLLVGIGEFISMATQSGTATLLLVGFFRSLSGVLNVVEGALRLIDSVFGDLFRNLTDNIVGMDRLTGGIEGIGTSFVAAGQDVGKLKSQLEDVNTEIARMDKKKSATDSLWTKSGREAARGFTDKDYEAAIARREALTQAIAEAERDAAAATGDHASAVRNLSDSLQKLNDQMRSQFDAQSAMEEAIDKAVEGAKKLSGVEFKNGMFNLDTEKGREAWKLVSDLQKTTGEYVEQLKAAGAPQSEINAAWAHGRENLIGLSDELNISKSELALLANQIFMTPDVKNILINALTGQAGLDLVAVQDKIRNTKGKSFTMKALTEEAKAALQVLGFKVQNTKGKSVKITIPTGSSNLGAINTIQAAINGIYGRTIGIGVSLRATAWDQDANGVPDMVQAQQARGSVLDFYARGGVRESHVAQIAPAGAMRVWAERETGGEAYIPLSPAKRMRSREIARETVSRLGGSVEWFARGGVRGSAKGAKDEIRAATSGDTEKRLLKLMDAIAKGSMKLSTAFKKVNSELDKAKSRLSDLRSSRSSLRDSVKGGVLSASDITGGFDRDKPVTVQTVMAGLTRSRDKATAFADALKRLRKRGLNKQLLQQIAEAGVEGGGLETAGALLTASGSELASMSSLQSQISKAASSAGKTTADALYAKSIKAQEKLVKALDKLADQLKKATKKKATGGIIGAASGGLRGGLTLVGEQGPEMVRLPYGSSVYSNSDTRRILGGRGGSGGGAVVIPIYIGGKQLDEVVVDVVRRTARARGGNVQVAFGR